MLQYRKEKPETIEQMFDSIAANYDRTNTLISFGLHKLWNKNLIERVAFAKEINLAIDLCCGTGEIGLNLQKYVKKPSKIYLIDFSQEMLDCAKAKYEKQKEKGPAVAFLKEDAEKISLPDSIADCITIAYGIRNINNPNNCLAEAFRVLKPGGRLGILELTRPSNRLLKSGHSLYLNTILPLIGKIGTSNKNAYNYLSSSIERFVEPDLLAEQMRSKGFNHIKRIPLFGGIATIMLGERP